MQLLFVGVGGTRKVTARQFKDIYTGGFRIHTANIKFHVDPGPSAVILSSQMGIKVEDTDVVIVSHAHLDHFSDIGVFAEAMNGFGFKKQGILICHLNCVNHREDFSRAISLYHESLFAKVYALKDNENVEEQINGQAFKLKTTKVSHDKRLGGIGFVLEVEGKKIGYTSDTEYFPGLFEQFKGVDVLIANITTITKPRFNPHLCVSDIDKIFDEANPKKLFFYHLGEEIINYGPKKL
jgi:phosphoribosyl 1,2-cyclic phosphodiesterase